jgi:uncharacterized coiled-coil DUF342 family protein
MDDELRERLRVAIDRLQDLVDAIENMGREPHLTVEDITQLRRQKSDAEETVDALFAELGQRIERRGRA